MVVAVLVGGAMADAQLQAPQEPPDPHLLVVPATPEGEAALAGSDARLIARYEAFSLVEAAGADDQRLRQAGADRRDDMRTVRTAMGTLDPKTRRRSLAGKEAPDRDEVLAIVQFVGPPKDAWVERVRATGARIVIYQAENSYVVHAEGQEVDRLAALVGGYAPVRTVAVLTAADKLESAESPTGRYAVQTVSGAEGEQARADATAAGTGVGRTVGLGQLQTQYLALSAAEAAELARDPAVVAVEPYGTPELADERGAQIVAGNLTAGFGPSASSYLDWLIDPDRIPNDDDFGFAIDVSDAGLDGGTNPPAHSDFRSRGSGASRIAYFKNYSSDTAGSTSRDCGGHGTNVASIATGYNDAAGSLVEDGAGFNHGLGVAPFAKVGASKVFNCAQVFSSGFAAATLASEAYNAGARISNNSWGTGDQVGWGDYNALAQQYDALVRDARGSDAGNQELVEVFAAGNDGEDTPDEGPNEGYGTILAEGTAKNVITVGAAEGVRASGLDGCGVPNSGADSARDIIDFSSRGPTDDGRLKPDLVAPGTHMVGARPRHSGYTGNGACVPFFGGASAFYSLISGSSQAAPHVSGAAALVRHWYNRTQGLDPSPALTKALLVNTATDLAGGTTGKGATIAAGPNTDQGWGRVNVGSALDSTSREYRDQVVADRFTSAGESVRKTYLVQDPTKPVKVTLVWSDSPGPTVGNAWVNNLDLEVEARGHRYLGNVFGGAGSRTGGSADTRNNVESVFLPAAPAGRFAVTVKSLTVAGDGVPGNADPTDQDFALVVSNADEQDAPVLVHAATTVADPAPGGDNDGVFESDEEIELTEQVLNAGTVAAGGLSATLSESTSGFAVTQPSSVYPVLGPGATGSNSTAFEAGLDNASTCGVDVPATLDITTTTPSVETHTIPLVLATGEPGASATHSAAAPQVPLVIPDDSGIGVSSTVFVSPRGRIKDVNVVLPGTVATPALEHDFLGDVVIDLIGPDGTTVRLAEHPGGPDNYGKDFVNVTFDDEASLRLGAPDDPDPAQRPSYSGTFRPQNDQLSRFDGKDRRGIWTLRVRDLFETDTGTLRAWGLSSQKALCNFDSTPPDTNLVGAPGTPDADTSPTFAFNSPDAGVTFECQLDTADYEPCTSPKTYSGVPDGLHTFRVRAIDGSGNEDATPAEHTWTIDTTPPDTTIISGPAPGSFSSSTSAAFTFTSEPQARFECSLDGAPFTDCADPQPQTYSGLPEGTHTFRVRAIDLADNVDPTPATRSWTVDTTAPIPSVTGPTGPTVDSEPLLRGIAGIAPGDLGTVSVRVYPGSGISGPAERTLTATVNPATGAWSVEALPALSLGDHTVQVQQNDAAGNLPGLSAPLVFTVIPDFVAPVVRLTQPVNGSSTRDTTPTLAGIAGTAEGDDGTVTLKVWNGTLAAGLPAQTLIVPRNGATGAFSALPAALREGTYTVRAEQGDSGLNDQGLSSNNVGVSGSATFTVSLPDVPKPSSAAKAPSFALAPAEERLSDALANRYTVLAACDSACRVNAKLTVSAEAARRLGMKARAVTIGNGVEKLAKAGAASVQVGLNPTARKALRGRISSSATLKLIVRAAGRKELTLERKVTLRRSAGLERITRRGMRFWAVCSKACGLRGALRISAASARNLGLKATGGERVTIASGRTSTGLTPKKLVLEVPSSSKKSLRNARKLTAILEATAGSASTGQRSARRSLTLR